MFYIYTIFIVNISLNQKVRMYQPADSFGNKSSALMSFVQVFYTSHYSIFISNDFSPHWAYIQLTYYP